MSDYQPGCSVNLKLRNLIVKALNLNVLGTSPRTNKYPEASDDPEGFVAVQMYSPSSFWLTFFMISEPSFPKEYLFPGKSFFVLNRHSMEAEAFSASVQ